jgi:hypothetical protein
VSAASQVGIALKPATPAELVLPYLQQGLLDLVSFVVHTTSLS